MTDDLIQDRDTGLWIPESAKPKPRPFPPVLTVGVVEVPKPPPPKPAPRNLFITEGSRRIVGRGNP